MRTIALISQLPEVGKTTIAVNLGHALALQGRRVMLVDLDPRGQLSSHLGLFRVPAAGVDSVLLDGSNLADRSVATRELLEAVPAGARLGQVETVAGGLARAKVLRDSLHGQPPEVDYLIFDCPPSAGLLMINAVVATDEVLIPLTGDDASLVGLEKLLGTLDRLEGLREQPLRRRVCLNRIQPRRPQSVELRDRVRGRFPAQLLGASLREAPLLGECTAAGRTVFEFRSRSKAAEEFRLLAEEVAGAQE